ncbi:MAG: molybdopterin-dependent oxidoreductase [Deltaproteobacteria bacterium]|jgi:anaerobic selenocysteine-containing dehydrogenase|nr:molybdopterin-dependent oxidoreductase [Deltaproteobacteria bacterium]
MEGPKSSDHPPKDYRTTCNRDCPDSCAVIATVKDGKIIKHKGDPEHGVTRGFLCSRGNDYLKRFYDPQRLLYPLRRKGNGWERISWGEALDLVAEKLKYYRDAYGPRSVLVVNYSAIHSWIPRVLGRLFWSHFGGATFASGGLSVEAAHAAQQLDFGGDCTHEPEDLVHSKAFVIWGKNVAVTRQHWMPFINQARKAGALLAAIDPVYSEMARKADRFYQIRPGSDGLLAIGVSRLLLERQAVDEGFIADHTHGFEAYRQLVLSYRLEDIAKAVDLSLDQIKEIADWYATRKPLATFTGLGPAYWSNGGAMIRLVDALAAVSGNIGISGGGMSTDIEGAKGLNLSMLRGAPKGQSRRILLPRLGEDILNTKDPALKMGWIAGANPASSAPDTGRVQEGLSSLEFLVVVEQFMSATAELAHLVLPCTTYLEMDDLVTAYGHNWIGLTNRVVPPLGETKTDGEIFQLLAGRLGFGQALAGEPRAWIQKFLEPMAREGLTLERLKEKAYRNPNAASVPFADRKFRTPSGKFEFITQFTPGPIPGNGGLHLVATKTLRMLNSQVLPEDVPEEPIARVNPAVLAEREFSEGQKVWVVSKAGKVRVRLAADEKVRRDVLLLNPALWRGDLNGVNQLRESFLTDIGDGAAMHQTMVTFTAE